MMKIISDFSKDTQTDKPLAGSYEWWYFDAVSPDGYTIVVIFYDGNPFSRRYIEALKKDKTANASDFPAVSISVYQNEEPVFYSFNEVEPAEVFFSKSEANGRVSSNLFEGKKDGDEICYRLLLDQPLPGGDWINGNLIFRSVEKGVLLPHQINKGEISNHSWNLVQPVAEVNGRIEIGGLQNRKIEFTGTGYHDHNVGTEPMKDSFDEWYWGRYHFEGFTLIYYLMLLRGEWKKKAWLTDDAGNISGNLDVELKEKELSLFGLRSSRKIEFSGPDCKAFLQKDIVLDSGPFYQRFKGNAVLNINGDLNRAVGISEYIKPSRIYNRWFWPLIDMRINYPGKVHWVQKNPVLYRWTW